MILYKNGYKTAPILNADPRRDIFSRNIYEGGGAQMGYTYRNIIGADGASGSPPMHLGGADAVPTSGKPTVGNDYPWDERFTGLAVVNWIREGVGRPAGKWRP